MEQFQDIPKRGGSQLISKFQIKLEAQIREKFKTFQHRNEGNKANGRSSVSEWLPTVAGIAVSALAPYAIRGAGAAATTVLRLFRR